ncbi:hypothetical protein PanWU01x14_285700 [Parasponia andersonii]|uniref:Uncharacterized protein n=1 Tax=Parasponia andersonii TaxID=3476 RepID=A0A2P5AZD7_PARAD|nr:hypothetical protein PanWU01x14_285700 [Parasponia andersonii]
MERRYILCVSDSRGLERKRKRELRGGVYVSLTEVDSGGFRDGVTDAVDFSVTSGARITVDFFDLTISFDRRLLLVSLTQT